MRFRIERMTDCEFRNLNIDYGFYNTPVGEILIASTVRGICCIELADNRDEALQLLCKRFAKSSLQNLLNRYILRSFTTRLCAFLIKMKGCLQMKLFYIFTVRIFR